MLLFVEVTFSCVVWHFSKNVLVLLANGKLPLNGTLFFLVRLNFENSKAMNSKLLIEPACPVGRLIPLFSGILY